MQAICRGYGVTDDVTSPTFALVHRYSAPRSRRCFTSTCTGSRGPQELTNIGWDEMLAEDALVLIEWPERAGDRIAARRTCRSVSSILPDDPSRRLLYAGGHA